MIDPTTGLDYNIFDLGFDRFLTKVADNADELGLPSVMKSNAVGITNPSNIASGGISQNIRMVDGYIQSSDYMPGVSGWRISADGNVEFAVGTFRGNIQGGQDAYNDGVGFFLGLSSGVYKFSIGDPNGTYITWDGTKLTIKGTIYADQLLYTKESLMVDWQSLDAWQRFDVDEIIGQIQMELGLGRMFMATGPTLANITAGICPPFGMKISWAKNAMGQMNVQLSTTDHQEVYFVVGTTKQTPYEGEDQMMGFKIVDGTLYAVHSKVSGGVSTEYTTTIAGITLTNQNIYRVEFTYGSKIDFFVNDTLVATHTANLPVVLETAIFTFQIKNTAASNRVIYIRNCYFSQDI